MTTARSCLWRWNAWVQARAFRSSLLVKSVELLEEEKSYHKVCSTECNCLILIPMAHETLFFQTAYN